MSVSRNRCLIVFCVLMLILSLATVASAQGPSAEAASEASGGALPQASSSPTATTDDGWHFGITPYLWFAGIHGTVGALGHQASVHASFGDIISNFNIGLMATFDARKKRFVTTTDVIWMRLKDDKALPENELGIQSIDAKITEFIITPKIGYRVVNKEKVTVDAMVGFRFWHLGQEFAFNPSLVGGISTSQNWADALGGARIQFPLSPKAIITIGGDAGGGGASSDYQVAGLFGYRVGKKVILQAGYRYMDVNFGGSNGFIFDAATSGIVGGVTINLK